MTEKQLARDNVTLTLENMRLELENERLEKEAKEMAQASSEHSRVSFYNLAAAMSLVDRVNDEAISRLSTEAANDYSGAVDHLLKSLRHAEEFYNDHYCEYL